MPLLLVVVPLLLAAMPLVGTVGSWHLAHSHLSQLFRSRSAQGFGTERWRKSALLLSTEA